MRIKKIAFCVTACVVLVAVTVSSVYAMSAASKEKNVYQRAADNGIKISDVDTEKNFKYTEIKSNEGFTTNGKIEDGGSAEIVTEAFKDPKTAIYNKMLNTTDYYNEVELTLKTSMLDNQPATIKFQTNINEGYAYEAVSENGVLTSETYCAPSNDQLIFVDNAVKTYNQQYLSAYKRVDSPYIPLADRIYTAEDGIPCYVYRRNVTNCPLASYSLVPQEITFSYLKDFDAWSIVSNSISYLGRNCIQIEGKPSPYTAEKHNCDTFTMLVDSETGILMKFEGKKGINVSNYITVTDISFGKTRSAIKQFDAKQYSQYTDVTC